MASFRKRGTSWEYRVKFTDPATGKTKEKSKGGFKTKKEAQLEASEIEKQFYFGQHNVIKNQDVLLKDWFYEWLEEHGSHLQHKTLQIRKFYIESQIVPNLGHHKLVFLTRRDYQKFINSLLKNFAKSSVQTIHSIFNTAINKAVEMEILTHNKFRNITIKKEEPLEAENNFLTKNEVLIFMNAAKTSPFHHFIIASILLRTGMRKGEMLALKWEDINFEDKTISITKTRDENGVKPPKTKSSIRTIGIDETLTDDLKKYRTWQKKNKMQKGQNYRNSDLMITTPNGKELGEFGVNKVIDSILSKTKLHHITPHGLRHTHAVMLLESGADIKFVSERLGHTTVNMTADVYVHITKKYEGENILKLEHYLNG